jgi:hypothetical protein
MKRFNVLLSIICLWSLGAVNAQVCTPDPTITQTGFYPAVLDTAEIDVDYQQTLQIRVLKDTTIILFGSSQKAFIDSIILLNIVGLPAGFTYACYNANCRYVPDTTGCAVLNGKATTSDAGVYPLKLAVNIFGRLASGFKAVQPDTIRNLTLVVRGTSASVIDYAATPFKIYPNPSADGKVHLATSPNLLPATFEWYNSAGQLLGETLITESNTSLDLNQKEQILLFGRLKSNAGRDLWKGKIAVFQP